MEERPEELQERLESFYRIRSSLMRKYAIIQERKAQYVMATDIPLQLLSEERQARDELSQFDDQIAQIEHTLQHTTVSSVAQPGELQVVRDFIEQKFREHREYIDKKFDELSNLMPPKNV